MNALSAQQAEQFDPDEHLVRPIVHEPTPRVALHQEEIVSLLRATCNIKNGLPPNVALHETEEVKKVQSDFCKSMSDQSVHICGTCSEYKLLPRKTQDCGNFINYECTRCKTDKKKQNYSNFSSLNDMDPKKMPRHLPKLSTIEEMLIAKAEPLMTIYRLTNGALGHKGHVCTVAQNLGEFCNEFPRKVADLSVVIVKKKVSDAAPTHADFKVNREKVQNWLKWLKENHRSYRNITIDASSLQDLPEEDNVASQLFSYVEEATDASEAQDVEMEDAPTTQRGPEQGGASGNDAELERVFIPTRLIGDPRKSEEEDIRDTVLGTRENPLSYPAAGAPLSEFTTPHLQAMTFPTLFPYGVGDVTFGDRLYPVTLTDSNKHLTRYAEVIDGKLETRFASHPRWAHWAQNMAERHRMLSQRNVYLQRHPDDALMTEEELLKIINEGGVGLNEILSKMQSYNANITGTPAYFYNKRKELEALMEQEGLPTLWFTLSAADNHWEDLHVLLGSESHLGPDATEEDRAKARRKAVRDYPQIVDEFIDIRAKKLVETFFGKHGLEAKWYWFRGEFQKRGTLHIHGCLRLENAPDLNILGAVIYRGRAAHRVLSHVGIEKRDYLSPLEISQLKHQMVDDEWTEEDKVTLTLEQLSEEEIHDLKEDVKEGIFASIVVAEYNDFIVTTTHLNPPSDAREEKRSEETIYNPATDGCHPCTTKYSDWDCTSMEEKEEQYMKIINTCERHKCNENYCMRKGDCRFHYPFKLNERNGTHVKVKT